MMCPLGSRCHRKKHTNTAGLDKKIPFGNDLLTVESHEKWKPENSATKLSKIKRGAKEMCF